MDILSFSEFKNYYFKYGKCINDINKRKNKLNEKQLKSRYEKYKKSEEKKLEKQEVKKQELLKNPPPKVEKDLLWEEVKKKVFIRDNYSCRLLSMMKPAEIEQFKNNLDNKDLLNILDPAHVLSKSIFPQLKYDINNLVILNRVSHYFLDQHKHPLDGTYLYNDQVKEWWKAILGNEQYKRLKKRIKKLNIKENVI